jgi:hypothetical protein
VPDPEILPQPAPVVPKPQLYARGGGVLPIIPTTFEEVWRIAGAVTQSGLAPKGADTQEKASVIILHGLEVGLAPMTALQSIAVINGKPSLYGDGALAVVRASGLLEKFSERLVAEPMSASCTVKRRGEAALTRTFSWADAVKAGLASKPGTWQQYPNRMLQMRARAFALRDAFADVMKGIGIREEIEDIVPDLDLVPPPPPPPPELQQTPLERAIAKAKESNGDKLADQQVIWDEEIERPRTEADRV